MKDITSPIDKVPRFPSSFIHGKSPTAQILETAEAGSSATLLCDHILSLVIPFLCGPLEPNGVMDGWEFESIVPFGCGVKLS